MPLTVITNKSLANNSVTYVKVQRPWKDVSTTGSTISAGDRCLVGTANGTVAITLPSSGLVMGDEVEFADKDGTWSGNNCTVHSGIPANKIDTANNFVLNVSNTSVRMIYTGANVWRTQAWS